MPWTSTYQGSNNRFFPSSSLIPSSSYFQCLMQTVSHFSFIFFGATLNTLHFPSFRPSSYLCSPNSLREMSSSIYFDCQGDDVVLRKFLQRGAHMCLLLEHVVQPKGQELTFSKCLCRLLPLCGFLKETEQKGRGSAKKTFLIFTFVLMLF